MGENDMAGDRLKGRRIVVTGAARGMGLATAEMFAAEGASLALCDRDEQAVRANADRLGQFGAGCDVADEADVERFCAEAEQAMGGVDGLINAAGIFLMKPQMETSRAEWDRVLGVNLTGTMLMCKALASAMKRAGGGTMVNIASIGGLRPSSGSTAYCVSKAGVIMLTEVLAAELAPLNIQVNAIAPGFVKTKFSAAIWSDEQLNTATLAAIPQQRMAEPEEIAGIALYLASPASSFTTGATILVDGGQAIGSPLYNLK